jgi:uncharacterized coiled-coil DUF342 family protein
MLSQQEKKELLQKISEKRREISQLQTELNLANDKKESFFQKKTELSKKISSLIDDIKHNRNQRNELTKQVRSEKEERDKHNLDVKESVDKIKVLEKEREELIQKHNLKQDPIALIKQIRGIEFKIETQPMSFEEEKKLMKRIRDLKKHLEEAKAVVGVIDKMRELSRQIDEKKRTAQSTHRKVQSHAKASQEKHESLIESSKQIDDMKKEEEEAFRNFIENKKIFNELNDKLKLLLTEIKDLSQKADSNKMEVRDSFEKRQKETIEQKKLSVEEKFKKGLKLTTEDLLAFQSTDKD